MLAMHMEDFHVVQNLINWDPSLRYLAVLAMGGFQEYEIEKIRLSGAAKRGEVVSRSKNNSSLIMSPP
jgi:hypothetical protein